MRPLPLALVPPPQFAQVFALGREAMGEDVGDEGGDEGRTINQFVLLELVLPVKRASQQRVR